MKGGLLLQLLWLFGSLSLIAIGGANVLIPEIHRHVVEMRGWMSDASFAELFAISQAMPGPNVMLASIIGWHLAGLAGLLVATVAILTPPALLSLLAGRGVRRWSDSKWVRIVTAGLVPLALGLMLASGIVATRAAGAGMMGYAITAGVGVCVFFSKRNPLLWMAIGVIAFCLLSALPAVGDGISIASPFAPH